MTAYAKLRDAVRASLAYEEWAKAGGREQSAEARSAFIEGYRQGFDEGYEQGGLAASE